MSITRLPEYTAATLAATDDDTLAETERLILEHANLIDDLVEAIEATQTTAPWRVQLEGDWLERETPVDIVDHDVELGCLVRQGAREPGAWADCFDLALRSPPDDPARAPESRGGSSLCLDHFTDYRWDAPVRLPWKVFVSTFELIASKATRTSSVLHALWSRDRSAHQRRTVDQRRRRAMNSVFTYTTAVDCSYIAVTAHGDLDIAVADALNELLETYRASDCINLTIYVSDVPFIDAWALRTITHLQKIAVSRGGSVTLVGASRAVHKVVELTGANQLVELIPPVRRLQSAD